MLAMVSPAAPLPRPVGPRAGGTCAVDLVAPPKLAAATLDARLRGGDAASALLRRRAISAPRIGCPMPAVPRQLAAMTPDIGG